LLDWNNLINAMMNGFFVGLGSATATYVVTQRLIKNFEKIEEKVKVNGKQ
jgi:hypothetical protein